MVMTGPTLDCPLLWCSFLPSPDSILSNLGMIKGDENDETEALDGESDGVFREYFVFDQKCHVPPAHHGLERCMSTRCSFFLCFPTIVYSMLTYCCCWQTLTLPIAGVTTWTALNSSAFGQRGRFALLQGKNDGSEFPNSESDCRSF